MKTYIFHVKGAHCASCKILIEDILKEQDFVKNVQVNLRKEIVEIGTDSEKSAEEIIIAINPKIKPNGYTLSTDFPEALLLENLWKQSHWKNLWNDDTLWKAIPIGLVFLALFFLLQKSGILNFGIGGETTPVTSFIIGLIASVSSCLAIVGGLVLSLSAKIEQDEDDRSAKKTFVLFHAGRLVGFALLGGLLGSIGKAIGVNFIFSAILGLIASAVMISLGFNLTGIFKKSMFTIPSDIFSFFRKVEHDLWAPILIGTGTFFLPCGFTQSMQVAALSSGSFTSGFLIMFAFALGTLPMLALLSFGSASFAYSRHAPLFFKSAGIVVVGLGVFSFLAGLAGLGIINPLFNI